MEKAEIIDTFGTYHTPPSYYNNPMENVLVATQNLVGIPIHGNSPDEQKARGAVELLKTAIAQQTQYSQGFSYLHGSPCPIGSRQADSLAPALPSSPRQKKKHPTQEPQQETRLPTHPVITTQERA